MWQIGSQDPGEFRAMTGALLLFSLIDAGSSSKFAAYDDEALLLSGQVDGIGVHPGVSVREAREEAMDGGSAEEKSAIFTFDQSSSVGFSTTAQPCRNGLPAPSITRR